MINIIIWLIFFPLATTINEYINNKNRILKGEELDSKEVKTKVAIIEFVVFLIVLFILINQSKG